MGDCLSRAALAPVNYAKEVKALKIPDVTMKGTPMYPAFPITLLGSLLSLLALAIYMIFYFFESDQSQACYSHITYGIIALAIAYPIESVFILVCLMGSAALATTQCWKIMIAIFMGLLVTGFSFGGLGFVYLCTINEVNPILIHSSFLSSNTWIQVIVYTYLSFFGLYVILVPLITCSYAKRTEEAKGGCCDTCCCILFYFCNILFIITGIFMIAIKLLGPPLLIYVLIEEGRSGLYSSSSSHAAFFSLTILSICLPVAGFLVCKVLGCIFSGRSADEEEGDGEMESGRQNLGHKEGEKQKQIAFLTNEDHKQFEDDNYATGNQKL